MKSIGTVGCLFLASLIGSAPVVLGQPRGAGARMPAYDTSTETTITGTVEKVMQTQRNRVTGTQLVVKTTEGNMEIHLGPADFVSREGFTFSPGDNVEVLGSKVTIGQTAALIAREVTKDGRKLVLRDDRGRPMWARPGGPNRCCAQ